MHGVDGSIDGRSRVILVQGFSRQPTLSVDALIDGDVDGTFRRRRCVLAKTDGFDFGNGLEDLQVCHSLGNV